MPAEQTITALPRRSGEFVWYELSAGVVLQFYWQVSVTDPGPRAAELANL